MFADGEQSIRLKKSHYLAVVRAQRPILRRDQQDTLRSCSMVLCAAKPLHPPYEKHANVLTFQTGWPPFAPGLWRGSKGRGG